MARCWVYWCCSEYGCEEVEEMLLGVLSELTLEEELKSELAAESGAVCVVV